MVVDATVLDGLRNLQDGKTALMGQPGSSSTATPLLTASTIRFIQPGSSESTQSSCPEPGPLGRGRYTNSEWNTEHKVFKRYDQVARKWEYRHAAGMWEAI
jgi:hypothetical protein